MPDDETAIATALSMVEVAVADMAATGLPPMQIAVALAWHLNAQVDLAMPTEETARMFKRSLIGEAM